MPTRTTLPHLSADRPFLADGGLETTLVFHDGIELPDFACFPLLDSSTGRAALTRYYTPYLDVAARLELGMVVDTPTWRANLDWGARLGYDPISLASVNRRAVDFVADLAKQRPSVTTVISGVIGPRGDGYVIGETMTPSEAAAYHSLQARSFAEAGAHVVSAITMTYSDEAIGVARAANAVSLPSVISFTVETDGRLPSGETVAEAITRVDDATDASPAYYMVNCAHPTHFDGAIDPASSWGERIRGIRANASRLSHAELDESTELDRGDIDDLADRYQALSSQLDLCVVGGCCGTDHEHIAAIATAVLRTEAVR
jgi:S-methylmethionine-dependent homocysteine/selenocysteine methylase